MTSRTCEIIATAIRLAGGLDCGVTVSQGHHWGTVRNHLLLNSSGSYVSIPLVTDDGNSMLVIEIQAPDQV